MHFNIFNTTNCCTIKSTLICKKIYVKLNVYVAETFNFTNLTIFVHKPSGK